MKDVLETIATCISIGSVMIIIYGTLLAIGLFITNEFKKNKYNGIRSIRVKFGTYLLLGLELLISADIVKTILEPGYEELIVLAGVVVVRTLMSVFLNKEIKQLKAENEPEKIKES